MSNHRNDPPDGAYLATMAVFTRELDWLEGRYEFWKNQAPRDQGSIVDEVGRAAVTLEMLRKSLEYRPD